MYIRKSIRQTEAHPTETLPTEPTSMIALVTLDRIVRSRCCVTILRWRDGRRGSRLFQIILLYQSTGADVGVGVEADFKLEFLEKQQVANREQDSALLVILVGSNLLFRASWP